MEIKLRLICILVEYPLPKRPEEYLSKSQFSVSLQEFPLPSVNSIAIKYEVNTGLILDLVVKQGEALHRWDVYKNDKLYFSFVYNNRADFIDVFEGQLKQELGKQLNKKSVMT